MSLLIKRNCSKNSKLPESAVYHYMDSLCPYNLREVLLAMRCLKDLLNTLLNLREKDVFGDTDHKESW